jgi:hypothetical protein
LEARSEGEAYCSVHVRFSEGLFAAWLLESGKAKYDADFDGKQRAVRLYRLGCAPNVLDCARLEAYAEAFVRTLAAAGIDAYSESRLD